MRSAPPDNQVAHAFEEEHTFTCLTYGRLKYRMDRTHMEPDYGVR